MTLGFLGVEILYSQKKIFPSIQYNRHIESNGGQMKGSLPSNNLPETLVESSTINSHIFITISNTSKY